MIQDQTIRDQLNQAITDTLYKAQLTEWKRSFELITKNQAHDLWMLIGHFTLDNILNDIDHLSSQIVIQETQMSKLKENVEEMFNFFNSIAGRDTTYLMNFVENCIKPF